MARKLEWRCLTCGITATPTATGFVSILKHPCDDRKIHLIDMDTGEDLANNIVQAQSKGLIPRKDKGKKPSKAETSGKKPSIGVNGDEHIKEHYQGYSKDGESFLFVMHPDGRVRDLRLEHPLLYPIFQLMRDQRGYGGDFVQFIADAVETLFANAGYELALVPKSQSVIYQEVVKLLEQGKLELVTNEDTVTLEVKNGNKDGRAAEQDLLECEESPGSESTQQGQGEQKPGQSQ